MSEDTSPTRAGHTHKIPFHTRLSEAIFAAPRAIHLLLLLICILLGFALVTQVRAQRSDPLESLSEEDLVVLLSELNAQENSLRLERANLQAKVAELESAANEQEAQAEAAQAAELQARINAGAVPVHGPGVIMRVSDPEGALSATEFVMTLGELRNAGAEAIELNGIRLSTRSAFVGAGGQILVDGTPISSPYDWRAIGASQTISTALEIQAGSAAQMRAKGAQVSIMENPDFRIESVATVPQPQFASPMTEDLHSE
ncbi:DUF881 domain-containing protein [Schaalia cardiffensis]